MLGTTQDDVTSDRSGTLCAAADTGMPQNDFVAIISVKSLWRWRKWNRAERARGYPGGGGGRMDHEVHDALRWTILVERYVEDVRRRMRLPFMRRPRAVSLFAMGNNIEKLELISYLPQFCGTVGAAFKIELKFYREKDLTIDNEQTQD